MMYTLAIANRFHFNEMSIGRDIHIVHFGFLSFYHGIFLCVWCSYRILCSALMRLWISRIKQKKGVLQNKMQQYKTDFHSMSFNHKRSVTIPYNWLRVAFRFCFVCISLFWTKWITLTMSIKLCWVGRNIFKCHSPRYFPFFWLLAFSSLGC